ncbi:MAG TPA: bifunctional riboflavin kinase/FAD synthetase [Euzebyales bacterium]
MSAPDVVVGDLSAVALTPSAVSVGFFDGVHRGHQAIIGRSQDHAARHGLRSVVVTFDRHPLQIVRPDKVPPLLMTTPRRARTLADLGVDAVVVLPFDERLRMLSAETFITRVLRGALDARHIVVGGNFRFGHGAAGDVDLLTRVGARDGFTVDGVDLLTADGEEISSSRIRAALGDGDVDLAARLLGRPFGIDGTVIHGDHRGKGLGYPTANLEVDDRVVVPATGVYAGVLTHPDGRELPAVTSIGTNPTFNGATLRVETYVLDFDEDLYGLDVMVDLRRFLRGQQRFDDVAALIAAMDGDVRRARRVGADDHLPGGVGGRMT